MTLNSGTKLGRYEIRSQIGADGMGEVYLAQDTKLDFDLSRDGKPTLFSRGATTKDVVLISGFRK
jgi:serine/threonine protein kinase